MEHHGRVGNVRAREAKTSLGILLAKRVVRASMQLLPLLWNQILWVYVVCDVNIELILGISYSHSFVDCGVAIRGLLKNNI